uniref:Uncharacterized protein LOC100176973 n=1 Tax=Phallusia mammillata TaxID=59560 RepID=A0A6F9DGT5_9ASCI|nr:uncharacterized protein LOC100176973 [Phallusia mammillata]
MMQGLSRIVTNEMSHDQFVETFGSCSPSPTTSETMIFDSSTEDIKLSNALAASEVMESNHGHNQVTLRRQRLNRNMNGTSREPMRALKPHGHLSASQENILSNSESAPRRNSKFSTIANRLARRSFRLGTKKKAVSEGSITVESTNLRPPTPTRLGAFFKRSKSVNRQASSDCTITSFRTLPDNDVVMRPAASTPSRIEARQRRSKVSRSMSLSPSTSLLLKTNLDSMKRRSAFVPSRWEDISSDETIVDGKEHVDILQQILEQKQQILDEQRRFREKSFVTRLSEEDYSPEHKVTKKYDSIRQNEEMRVVAIVALLNRRKNSLKIKCDQFEKNVSDSAGLDERSKFMQERLRNFRRKLSVVEQCIEEQKDSVKLSSAKLELKCCLELFQLGLQKDEELISQGSVVKTSRNEKRHATLTAAPSCETLGSLDDTSVFGDSATTSVMSLRFDQSSPIPHYKRNTSATYRQTSPIEAKSNTTLDDSCEKQSPNDTGRSRSIDLAITSDCDSGFDNGDTLSRSDISLDGNLSKSTGSIVSSCSHSTRTDSNTASCQTSPSPSGKQPLTRVTVSDTRKLPGMSVSSKHNEYATQIEDFELFAEKRMRCISNNGKLVPLKSGC